MRLLHGLQQVENLTLRLFMTDFISQSSRERKSCEKKLCFGVLNFVMTIHSRVKFYSQCPIVIDFWAKNVIFLTEAPQATTQVSDDGDKGCPELPTVLKSNEKGKFWSINCKGRSRNNYLGDVWRHFFLHPTTYRIWFIFGTTTHRT